jgi:hypothetical protein
MDGAMVIQATYSSRASLAAFVLKWVPDELAATSAGGPAPRKAVKVFRGFFHFCFNFCISVRMAKAPNVVVMAMRIARTSFMPARCARKQKTIKSADIMIFAKNRIW